MCRLEARLKAAERRNKELREEVCVARREAKRQAGPFRRRRRVKNPKRPGRKHGHAAANRAVPSHVDAEIAVPLLECPGCRGEVDDVKDLAPQVMIDIPRDVKLDVRRFHNQSGWCGQCRCRVRSRHADQTSTANGAAGVQIGPRAWSLAVDLKHRIGAPYRKVVEVFALAIGLCFTAGALVRAEKRIAARCEPTYQALVHVVRKAAVVHSDETGWYITSAAKKAWLWVFAASRPRITIFAIRLSRGVDVVEEILGADFAGVLGVDGWAGYIGMACRKGQCGSHLLRRCSELLLVQKQGAARFPHAVRRLLVAGMRLKALSTTMPERPYRAQRNEIVAGMARLLRGHVVEPLNLRFLKHLRRHEDEIFTYLDVPDLPPTNNLAEQEIRPAVVVRKISCGNRSDDGAHVHEVLATVSRTAERNGLSLPALLPAVLCSSDEDAVMPLIDALEPPMPCAAQEDLDGQETAHPRRGPVERVSEGDRRRGRRRHRAVHRDRDHPREPIRRAPTAIRGDPRCGREPGRGRRR